MVRQKTNQKLSQQYYDPRRPGSFGGVDALKRATKVSRQKVQEWLSGEETYTLHKPIRQKFQRRKIVVSGTDKQWQADLVDVRNIKKQNDGFTFLLTVIDVFSKYAWVVPLKDKTGLSVVRAFKQIFAEDHRKPVKLQTDKGTEFSNRTFQTYLREQGVEFFVTQNEDIKAAVVERFNRTLKQRLYRYFTRKNTSRFIEVLPSLVRSYNRSYHRSIKRAPVSVTADKQEEVWQTLYGDHAVGGARHRTLQPGDRVRISKAKKTFRKAYLGNWSEELFTVSRVLKTSPVTYKLKDDNGEEIVGSFYQQEIQKVKDKTLYRIEAILDRRQASDSKGPMILVRWFGYSDKFDSWIPEKHLQKYKG